MTGLPLAAAAGLAERLGPRVEQFNGGAQRPRRIRQVEVVHQAVAPIVGAGVAILHAEAELVVEDQVIVERQRQRAA